MSWKSTLALAGIPDLPEQAFRAHPMARRPATLEGGKGGGSAPSPDPNIGIAQRQFADLANRQQSMIEGQVWPELLGLQRRAQDVSERQTAAQEAIQNEQLDQGRYYFDRFQNVQAPHEDRIFQEAQEYNSDAEAQARAQTAQTDVSQQYGLARGQMQRQLGRMGINPGQANSVAAMQRAGLSEAQAKAYATSQVREAAKQIGWARNMEAAALGRGLPGFSSTSSQIASGAGMNAMNAANSPIGTLNQSAGTLNQGFAGQGNAWGNVGNLGVQTYGIQSQNWQNEQNNNPLNAILGAAAGVGTGWGLKAFGPK